MSQRDKIAARLDKLQESARIQRAVQPDDAQVFVGQMVMRKTSGQNLYVVMGVFGIEGDIASEPDGERWDALFTVTNETRIPAAKSTNHLTIQEMWYDRNQPYLFPEQQEEGQP